MKIYLAGPWDDRDKCRALSLLVIGAGHTITREWWDLEAGDEEHEKLGYLAQLDLDAVKEADVLIVWNGRKSEGKAVETGYALALGKPVLVVGPMLNIFYYLPQVRRFTSFEEAIRALSTLRV